uniref:hypothetical protein n=1 Tax=Anabaena sp. CCY 0017 TaxID=3103866 RepID=UPI0039C6432F
QNRLVCSLKRLCLQFATATVANNQDEREARERVMAQYPDTPKGKLLGLRTFTDAYIPALKENKGFHHIGQGRHQATQQGDLPPTTAGDHDWQSRNEGDSAERCANRLTPALSAKHTFRDSPKY